LQPSLFIWEREMPSSHGKKPADPECGGFLRRTDNGSLRNLGCFPPQEKNSILEAVLLLSFCEPIFHSLTMLFVRFSAPFALCSSAILMQYGPRRKSQNRLKRTPKAGFA